jgi:multidrug resistance efflux pump
MRILPVPAHIFTQSPLTNYTDGNFTSVSQRIPVQISLDSNYGKQLYPGGSAHVTIYSR